MTRRAARLSVPCLLALSTLAGCGADPTGPTGDMLAVRSQSELQSHLGQSDRPTVVFFYLSRCPHSRAAAPALAELSEEYSDRADFVKINGAGSRVAARHNIQGYPTVLILAGDRERKRLRGRKLKGTYEQAIRDALDL